MTAELRDYDPGQSHGRYEACSLPDGADLEEIEEVDLVAYQARSGETLADLSAEAVEGLEAAFRVEIERDGANRASVEERLFEAAEGCFAD